MGICNTTGGGFGQNPKAVGPGGVEGCLCGEKKRSGLPYLKKTPKDTVDGQNLAPPGMVKTL